MVYSGIKTISDLIAKEYKRPKVIEQIRTNLRCKLRAGDPVFEGRYLIDPDTFSPGKALQANSGILYIDELPDLAPKTQVCLFNLMEERIVVAKGYPIEFSVDLLLVATANPVDYTTAGKIVEPLLDRFGSGIYTHYPRTLEEERQIMVQESFHNRDSLPLQLEKVLSSRLQPRVGDGPSSKARAEHV